MDNSSSPVTVRQSVGDKFDNETFLFVVYEFQCDRGGFKMVSTFRDEVLEVFEGAVFLDLPREFEPEQVIGINSLRQDAGLFGALEPFFDRAAFQ